MRFVSACHVCFLCSSYKTLTKAKIHSCDPCFLFRVARQLLEYRKARQSICPLPRSETVIEKWKSPPHENLLPIFRFLIPKAKKKKRVALRSLLGKAFGSIV